MSVKLRLARIGTKNTPVFRLVAIDSRKKRDGRYLEDLGTYNPVAGTLLQFHAERFAYWVSQGAVQSDTVKKLNKLFQKQGVAQAKSVQTSMIDDGAKALKKTAKTIEIVVEKVDVQAPAESPVTDAVAPEANADE